MKLFDEIITDFQDIIKDYKITLATDKIIDWPEADEKSMILRSDMAYELGGGLKAGYGCTLVTTNDTLVNNDAVFVLGKDLYDISQDSSFARIAICHIDDSKMGEGEQLYSSIRSIEFTRYHFYPEGFMIRASASKNKETVRIGKEGLKKGLSFSKAGSSMIKQFKKNPFVKAVQIYYITENTFDYKRIEAITQEAAKRIQTIDHILQTSMIDCKTCNLQDICNEVEELRELHFKVKNN